MRGALSARQWQRRNPPQHLANHDPVVLRVETGTARPSTLGDSDHVRVGDQIVVVGNPEGLEQTVSNGLVSGIREIDHRKLFQISAPISEGSSGSPVFNDRGEVIGVVVSSLESGQNLNFAVPINYAKPLLTSAKVESISSLPRGMHSPAEPVSGASDNAVAGPTKLAAQTMNRIAGEIRVCERSTTIHSTTDRKLPYIEYRDGPPTDVRFDVQPSDSLVASFQGRSNFPPILAFLDMRRRRRGLPPPLRGECFLIIWRIGWIRHRYFYRINGSEAQLADTSPLNWDHLGRAALSGRSQGRGEAPRLRITKRTHRVALGVKSHIYGYRCGNFLAQSYPLQSLKLVRGPVKLVFYGRFVALERARERFNCTKFHRCR